MITTGVRSKLKGLFKAAVATEIPLIAITGNQKMIPKRGQPNSNIVVYGPTEISDTRLSGGHVRAMMASAPFPIPIEFKGQFTAYKVDEADAK